MSKFNVDKSIIIASGNALNHIRESFGKYKFFSNHDEDFYYLGYPLLKFLRCSSMLMVLFIKFNRRLIAGLINLFLRLDVL